MKTRTIHKALSMLLTAAMVLNMGLSPVFAEGTAIAVPSGASALTECHSKHDDTCGYSETITTGGCTHEHGDCGYTEGIAEQPCKFVPDNDIEESLADTEEMEASLSDASEHSHDKNCGYAQATKGEPCTHKHDESCGYSETIAITAP